MKDIKILAIESSCDETAASVVQNGRTVLGLINWNPRSVDPSGSSDELATVALHEFFHVLGFAQGRFEALANRAQDAINKGVFLPNETSFACSECPYWNRCRQWHLKKWR